MCADFVVRNDLRLLLFAIRLRADFGRIASRVYIAWCFAAICLPILAGHLFDLTGGYATTVLVAGCGNLICALLNTREFIFIQ